MDSLILYIMKNTQKKLPKMEKKLTSFVSHNSSGISKKNIAAFGLGVMVLMNTIPNADAGSYHCNNSLQSASAVWGAQAPTTQIDEVLVDKDTEVRTPCGASMANIRGKLYVNKGVAPYSKIVNGHANWSAMIKGQGLEGMNLVYQTVHHHSNHSNHSSGGWC